MVMMEPCLGLCKNRRATQGALAEIGVAIRDPLDEAHVLAGADHLMSILAVLGAGLQSAFSLTDPLILGGLRAEVADAALVDIHGLHAIIEDLSDEIFLQALGIAVERYHIM
jgi:hypothetical protein